MKKIVLPGWIKAYFGFILANWLLFTLMRGIFLFVFRAALVPQSYPELWETFYVGAKFDMRLACALAIPLGLYFTVCAFGTKRGPSAKEWRGCTACWKPSCYWCIFWILRTIPIFPCASTTLF